MNYIWCLFLNRLYFACGFILHFNFSQDVDEATSVYVSSLQKSGFYSHYVEVAQGLQMVSVIARAVREDRIKRTQEGSYGLVTSVERVGSIP